MIADQFSQDQQRTLFLRQISYYSYSQFISLAKSLGENWNPADCIYQFSKVSLPVFPQCSGRQSSGLRTHLSEMMLSHLFLLYFHFWKLAERWGILVGLEGGELGCTELCKALILSLGGLFHFFILFLLSPGGLWQMMRNKTAHPLSKLYGEGKLYNGKGRLSVPKRWRETLWTEDVWSSIWRQQFVKKWHWKGLYE